MTSYRHKMQNNYSYLITYCMDHVSFLQMLPTQQIPRERLDTSWLANALICSEDMHEDKATLIFRSERPSFAVLEIFKPIVWTMFLSFRCCQLSRYPASAWIPLGWPTLSSAARICMKTRQHLGQKDHLLLSSRNI